MIFDTNVSNHHHFYDVETSELIDIDAKDVVIEKIPKAPNGKKIKNVEVFIKLKNWHFVSWFLSQNYYKIL